MAGVMDDGITIPPAPRGHDYGVVLRYVGTGIAWPDDWGTIVEPRILRILGARCPNKARDQACNRAGAGWRVVEVQQLRW